jgi:hypothetical protein
MRRETSLAFCNCQDLFPDTNSLAALIAVLLSNTDAIFGVFPFKKQKNEIAHIHQFLL